MIQSFGFSNFQSFYEWSEVNFVISKSSDSTRLKTKTESGEVLSNAVVIVGANAAGKTAILKVPSFILWFMTNSFLGIESEAQIPVVPHFAHKEEPSKFALVFEQEGIVWKYELVLTSTRVQKEVLYKKNKKFVIQFQRTWNPDQEKYHVDLKNFDFPIKQARLVRQNASLISTAIQFNVKAAIDLKFAIGYWFSNVNVLGKNSWLSQNQFELSAEYFTNNSDDHEQMTQVLNEWDLGLSGVRMKRFPAEVTAQNPAAKWDIQGVHISKGEEYLLPFGFESDGTKSLFNLLAAIIPLLKNGGIAIVDELESDMHPLMLKKIVNLFADPEINLGGAQLIFSTHSLEIMNFMDREQIILVEKLHDAESRAFPLIEVGGVRENENYYSKYISGTYGAIPSL